TRGASDANLLQSQRCRQGRRERKADLSCSGLNAADIKSGVARADFGPGEPAAGDRDLCGFAAAYRGRVNGRDRSRLRGTAGDYLQNVSGGVVDILGDAPLLVDDADEPAERGVVVALLGGAGL